MEQIGRPLYHDRMSSETAAHQASWQQWNRKSSEADGKVLGIALQNGFVRRKTEQRRKTKQRESPSEEMEAVIFHTNLFGRAGLGMSEHGD